MPKLLVNCSFERDASRTNNSNGCQHMQDKYQKLKQSLNNKTKKSTKNLPDTIKVKAWSCTMSQGLGHLVHNKHSKFKASNTYKFFRLQTGDFRHFQPSLSYFTLINITMIIPNLFTAAANIVSTTSTYLTFCLISSF